MEPIEWVVSGLACIAIVAGLMVGSLGRMIGTAGKFFALCVTAGLLTTLLTEMTSLHLLWYLPLAFLLSVSIAVYRVRRGIEASINEVASNPDMQNAFKAAIRENAERSRPEQADDDLE